LLRTVGNIFTTRRNTTIKTGAGNDRINAGLGVDSVDGGARIDPLIVDYGALGSASGGIVTTLVFLSSERHFYRHRRGNVRHATLDFDLETGCDRSSNFQSTAPATLSPS
jgi:hypothetical protein